MRAKELLRSNEERVFEISERVGYKDFKHFIMVFKKFTGTTPSDYRETRNIS